MLKSLMPVSKRNMERRIRQGLSTLSSLPAAVSSDFTLIVQKWVLRCRDYSGDF